MSKKCEQCGHDPSEPTLESLQEEVDELRKDLEEARKWQFVGPVTVAPAIPPPIGIQPTTPVVPWPHPLGPWSAPTSAPHALWNVGKFP